MLVLTRRRQKAIHIGDAIVVRAGKVRGGRVTLVIDALVRALGQWFASTRSPGTS